NEEKGLFFPQDLEYLCTSAMAKKIAEINNKKIYVTRLFNPLLKLMVYRGNIIKKIFGNLIYEQSISEYKESYVVRDFNASMKLTEIKEEEGVENKTRGN